MLIFVSIMLSCFYILFFTFFKPIVRKEYINSGIKEVGLFNILHSIMIYFYISIIVFYSAFLLNFGIIGYSFLILSLFLIFFINIKLQDLFFEKSINITLYKYIKNEKTEIYKNLVYLSFIYIILYFISYIFLKYINSDEFLNIINIIIIPFIGILFFSDKKYNLINDIIAIPLFIVVTYYIFFISTNIIILPFSYIMLGFTLGSITLVEFVLSKIKNKELILMGFSDIYIMYLLLLIVPFYFIIVFIIIYIISTIYAKYKNIKEFPLFGNILYVYIIYILIYGIDIIFNLKLLH